MIITNKFDLPEGIYNAVVNKEYSRGDADASITELIQPVQQRWLLKHYHNDVKVDVSESIYAILGTAVHSVLEEGTSQLKTRLYRLHNNIKVLISLGEPPEKILDSIKSAYKEFKDFENPVSLEKRWYSRIGDWIISGQPDWYKDPSVEDYKLTSVFKVMKKDYEDWIFQLNGYAHLIQSNNQPRITKLQVNAILRDFSEKEARNGDNPEYPTTRVVKVPILLLKPIDQLLMLAARIKFHQDAEQIEDESKLPKCSEKERWASAGEWVLYSEAKKWTYKSFRVEGEQTDEVAKTLAELALQQMNPETAAKGEYVVKFRAGTSLRCEYFCSVKEFCHQYKNEISNVKIILPDTE